MINLQKLNVVKAAADEAAAKRLEAKGFRRIGGTDEAGKNDSPEEKTAAKGGRSKGKEPAKEGKE